MLSVAIGACASRCVRSSRKTLAARTSGGQPHRTTIPWPMRCGFASDPSRARTTPWVGRLVHTRRTQDNDPGSMSHLARLPLVPTSAQGGRAANLLRCAPRGSWDNAVNTSHSARKLQRCVRFLFWRKTFARPCSLLLRVVCASEAEYVIAGDDCRGTDRKTLVYLETAG